MQEEQIQFQLEKAPIIQIFNQGGRSGILGILAIWENGYSIYSQDKIRGGSDYYFYKIDSVSILDLMLSLKQELSNMPKNINKYGPDSQFTTIRMRNSNGDVLINWSSWHNLIEADNNLVVTEKGIEPISNYKMNKSTIIASQSKEFQLFRKKWTAIRQKIFSLIPENNQNSIQIDNEELLWN